KYFHMAMKERRNFNRIEDVEDVEGKLYPGNEVADQDKAALFSMDDDKAPRPDGFSSKFFKASWSIVGSEVSQAIKDYFSN
ncbi:hypothetical protein Tco_1452629, partial [Tanacetum coccineum]